MSRTQTLFLIPLGIVGAGIALAAWMVMSRPEAASKPSQEKVWPVPVTVVEVARVVPKIVLFGEVRASRVAELRAEVAGRLVELSPEFIDGSRVRAGARLALVEPQDYEYRLAEQRAELRRSESLLTEYRRELKWESSLLENAERQVVLAERGLERSEQLARQGRESRKARDDAESALASAEQVRLQRVQTIERLRARIAQQQAAHEKAQAAHAMAERELAKTRLVAPFDGYVTDVDLAIGERVGVGETLGRLLAADQLEVGFDLPEADFGRLLADAGTTGGLLGGRLRVIWRLGEEVREFDATLTRVGAEIDPSIGGVRLFATIDSTAGEQGLRAGAFVAIHLNDVAYEAVARLPARAVSESGRIYVLKKDRLVELEAEVVRRLGDEVLVRAALESGDRVVARSFGGIGPGLRARPL